MVRTKQTQNGSSSARPVGIQAAVHGNQPEAEQFEDLDVEADEEDWPDFNDLLKAAQQAAKASKSTGKAGEGSQDVDKLTSGAQAPANVVQDPTKNPLQPKPCTSKADTPRLQLMIPPMSLPRPPPRIPLRHPPMTLPRLPPRTLPLIQPGTQRMSQILQIMLKVTGRQLKFGLTQCRIAKNKLTRHFTTLYSG